MAFLDFFKGDENTPSAKAKKMFSENFVTLESEDLRFVKISPCHAPDMYEYSKDDDVTRYLTWSSHSSLKQTENYVKLLQKKYAQGVFNDWGLVHKQTGKMIGTCGFTSFDDKSLLCEIGYVLSKDFWGKGLAAQAAKTIMKFAFENLGVEEICAKCIEGNDASMRVMQKCGMKFDAMYKNSMFIKGEYKTIIVYKVSKEQFYKEVE